MYELRAFQNGPIYHSQKDKKLLNKFRLFFMERRKFFMVFGKQLFVGRRKFRRRRCRQQLVKTFKKLNIYAFKPGFFYFCKNSSKKL
jgi:hypothetical protein